MEFTLDKRLTEKLPELKVGVLMFEGLTDPGDQDQAFQYQCHIVDEIRLKVASGQWEVLPEGIGNWDDAFQKIGIDPDRRKPSHIALFDRIISRKDLPNINSIVNLTNAISLKHLTPIGAHDVSDIDEGVTIGLIEKEMPFQQLTKEYDPIEYGNEYGYMDASEVITRHFVWRQSHKTMTTQKSTSFFIPIDTLGKSNDEIELIAKELIDAIRHFTQGGEFKFGVLTEKNNRIGLKDLMPIDSDRKIDVETKPISRDQKIIDRILTKAVEEILPSADSLEDLLKSGRRLRVYQGFDPTGDSLHIGHAVSMRKLEDFRKLGHEVIFLIGDFTARIGDPTDKSSARKRLTKDEVNNNLKEYRKQATAIVDMDNKDNPITVLFNNDWLSKMTFEEVNELAAEFSVQQMLKRDMFQRRMKEDRPIYINEFQYPLMQGWDSVAMNIDVEIGGNDQLFNMLAGRQLVERNLGKEKFVIAGKLLTTSDGAKMGKTEGNMIRLDDTSNDMYGKVMAFPDGAIIPGFELLTDLDMADVEERAKRLDTGTNPMELKKELALMLTAEHKGEKEAEAAAAYFEEIFQSKTFETDISKITLNGEQISVIEILVDHFGLEQSKSHLRRMIEQGAVKIDGKKISNWDEKITPVDGMIIKAGREVRRVSIK